MPKRLGSCRRKAVRRPPPKAPSKPTCRAQQGEPFGIHLKLFLQQIFLMAGLRGHGETGRQMRARVKRRATGRKKGGWGGEFISKPPLSFSGIEWSAHPVRQHISFSEERLSKPRANHYTVACKLYIEWNRIIEISEDRQRAGDRHSAD